MGRQRSKQEEQPRKRQKKRRETAFAAGSHTPNTLYHLQRWLPKRCFRSNVALQVMQLHLTPHSGQSQMFNCCTDQVAVGD
mmetsp:Transcript_31626/g.67154  ORF Transcript_31626/g.67154 Transcript_31626/m.67154 type:complete len:81 (-) Transcript_31626:19-261(-)